MTRPAPASYDYRTARDRFAIWGWDFAIDGQSTRAFTTIHDASIDGITINGHGIATVTTAPLFRPHQRVQVVIGTRTTELRGSRAGRLTVTLPLGTRDVVVRFEPK